MPSTLDPFIPGLGSFHAFGHRRSKASAHKHTWRRKIWTEVLGYEKLERYKFNYTLVLICLCGFFALTNRQNPCAVTITSDIDINEVAYWEGECRLVIPVFLFICLSIGCYGLGKMRSLSLAWTTGWLIVHLTLSSISSSSTTERVVREKQANPVQQECLMLINQLGEPTEC